MAGLAKGEHEGWVPVYLPDRTVAGEAKISVRDDDIYIDVKLSGFEGEAVAAMMAENLIGFSTVYMNNDARDSVAEAIEKEKEKN